MTTVKSEFTFVSVPGRRKSIKRAIVGLQQCQATLLCVSANKFAMELKHVEIGDPLMANNRERSVGVGYEHLELANAFGAARRIVVAVTKLDQCHDAEVGGAPPPVPITLRGAQRSPVASPVCQHPPHPVVPLMLVSCSLRPRLLKCRSSFARQPSALASGIRGTSTLCRRVR